MGAKQSKRSVDISGKEAESAGEVAAAGAGGEGRVEQLADADALKPQLNGDAHIHDAATDKEKQIDSGTPEMEKDVTTEKEGKEEEEEKEKETSAVTNGESEPKEGNGEAITTAEDSKKPKKEKVKKKWSLRSISFSRKDKPKQEKKAKEDDAKTPNGDSEKLPEEVAESTPDNAVNEVAEEVKSDVETKDEKTPETPVTDPITNGSSTPESPKTEPSPIDEPIPETPEDTIRPEPKVILAEPEQLPVNGLSLEESKVEIPEVTKIEESNIEKPTTETSESVAAPEIPVTKEVCVEQMSMIEPSPPPLPANPPPSSVASFAATTMAPELTDASLATSDITSTTTPIAITDTNKELIDQDSSQSNLNELDDGNVVTNTPTSINEIVEGNIAQDVLVEVKPASEDIDMTTGTEKSVEKLEITSDESYPENIISNITPVGKIVPENTEIPEIIHTEPLQSTENLPPTLKVSDSNESYDDSYAVGDKLPSSDNKEITIDNKNVAVSEMTNDTAADVEYLKNTAKDCEVALKENECNGIVEEESSEIDENPPNPNDTAEETENKVTTPEDSLPPSLSEVESHGGEVTNDGSESFPLPPSELCRYDEAPPANSPQPAASQDILTVADKMVDLIPEIPVVPELKTDMESSDVAVVN